MSDQHGDATPTDDELAQWLYDFEYDWNGEDYEAEMPSNTFPPYYDDENYRPTLAAIFRELIEFRAERSS